MTIAGYKVDPYWLLVLPLFAMLLALYAYPLVEVLVVSVTDPEPGLGNYEKLFTSRGIHRMLWTTARICAMTTAITMVLGYLLAYAMVHVRERHRLWILLFILFPFWVSVLIRSFAWLVLLRDNGVINNALIDFGIISDPLELMRNETGVVIGMVHFMVPYATFPLYANMRGIDSRLVQAARGLGAGPFESFWRVFLPLSMPGIIGAGLLVFIFSLGFFVTPAILGGGKTVMIAEYVSVNILTTVRWGLAAMLATTLLVATFALIAIMARFVNLRELFGAR
jgi:putative spermidine/putrescine transport system permease protein